MRPSVTQDRDAEIADRLGRAFGVWRLRPGDVEQPALVVACTRLQAAVTPRAGLTLGVHGATFVTAAGEQVGSGATGALATSLYELTIERLRLHRAPSVSELDAFFAAVEAAADVADLHARLGGLATVLDPIGVAPTAVLPDTPEEAEAWRDVWMELADPQHLARAVPRDEWSDPASFVQRMVALRAALPEDRQRSPILADRLHAGLLELPDDTRHAVAGELLAEPDAAFAAWFLCSLTDHDLAALLTGLSDDVPGLARRTLGRELDDITGEVDVPAPAPVVTPPLDDHVGNTGDSPLSTGSIELFLLHEHRPERWRAALLHWERRAKDALAAGDLATVHDLLALLHRVNALTEHDLTGVLDVACAQILGRHEIQGLLPSLGEPVAPENLELLRAFGPVAVDAVATCLVNEQDAQRRTQVVSVLAGLVPGNVPALARWVADERWFVVRNVVTALWRAADPSAADLLASAIAHPEPRVRIETGRALSAIGRVDGLAQLAADADDEVRTSARRMLVGLGSADAAAALGSVVRDERVPLGDRRSALDSLGSHPHGAAQLSVLAEASDLPLRLRWHAGRLAGSAR